MAKDPHVTIGARIPVEQWRQLEQLAQRRGYLRGDGANISKATREALGKGLAVIEKAAMEGQHDQDHD